MSDKMLKFLNKRIKDLEVSLDDSANLNHDEYSFLKGQIDELTTIHKFYMINKTMVTTEEWSNYAALGYAIEAATNIGLTDEQITKLVRGMHTAFDFKTIDEAAKIYTSSDY